MDVFNYVMVLVSVIAGLAITQLLQGVTQIIQEPGRVKLYWVQLVFALGNFLWVVSWWWFEFSLARQTWTFSLYLFVIAYAVVTYLRCSVSFPLAIDRAQDLRAYYYARRVPYFGLVLLQLLIDIADTMLKGWSHMVTLGPLYWIGMPIMAVGAVIAMKTRSHIYHACCSVVFLAYGMTVSLVLLNKVQ
jgi:hypothetical protein